MSRTIDEICADLIEQIQKSGSNFVKSVRTTKVEPLEFDKLIICGMGGSGISADYVTKLAEPKSSKQIIVNKSYEIPHQIDSSWNAVVVSYSGNTEETVACFNQLLEIGIKPVCITSNGKLEQLCDENKLRCIQLPPGIAPRVAFSFLFGSLYGLVARSLNLTLPNPDDEKILIETSKLENIAQLDIVAQELMNRFPIILSSSNLSNIGLRFRCQINENSKKSAANFELPEFSHNGIVGFDGNSIENQALILLRTNRENHRTSIHLDFFSHNIGDIGYVYELKTEGNTELEEHLRMTWILDYISVKLAQLQEIDPLGVPSIDELKSILRRS